MRFLSAILTIAFFASANTEKSSKNSPDVTPNQPQPTNRPNFDSKDPEELFAKLKRDYDEAKFDSDGSDVLVANFKRKLKELLNDGYPAEMAELQKKMSEVYEERHKEFLEKTNTESVEEQNRWNEL